MLHKQITNKWNKNEEKLSPAAAAPPAPKKKKRAKLGCFAKFPVIFLLLFAPAEATPAAAALPAPKKTKKKTKKIKKNE